MSKYRKWDLSKLEKELGVRHIPREAAYGSDDIAAILESSDLASKGISAFRKTGKKEICGELSDLLYDNVTSSVHVFYPLVRAYPDLLVLQTLGLTEMLTDYTIGGISALAGDEFTYLAPRHNYAYYLRSLRKIAQDHEVIFDNLMEIDVLFNERKPYLSGWIRQENVQALRKQLPGDVLYNFFTFSTQESESNSTEHNDKYVVRARKGGSWVYDGHILNNEEYFYEQSCFFARNNYPIISALLLSATYFVITPNCYGKYTTMDFIKSLLWNGTSLSPRRKEKEITNKEVTPRRKKRSVPSPFTADREEENEVSEIKEVAEESDEDSEETTSKTTPRPRTRKVPEKKKRAPSKRGKK